MNEIVEMYVDREDLAELQRTIVEMGNVAETCSDSLAKFPILDWRCKLIVMFGLRYYFEPTGKHATGRGRAEALRRAIDTDTVCELVQREMGSEFCMRFGSCNVCVATYALGILNQREMEVNHARVRDQQDQ